jgi:L-alanine-DL-glutamate epimerase-like enolase superfamily enzyme
MKITKIETVRVKDFPNLLWVEVHTDEGVAGLGETFFMSQTVESYVHEVVAPKLLDAIRSPSTASPRISPAISASARLALKCAAIRPSTSRCGPVRPRDRPARRTIAGRLFPAGNPHLQHLCRQHLYARRQRPEDGELRHWRPKKDYDDLNGFLNNADELAEDLLAEGITAMKIWPFDLAAEANDGQYISSVELKRALEPFEKIRKRVGDKIDIMVEFHSMWQLLPAIRSPRR